MIDYEAKFWLPFKGVEKPVYAIPGNHDWYDALEAFLATFLAARRRTRGHGGARRRRPQADEHDDDRASTSSIDEAARLRSEYRVPTGFQRGPFFEIQTDRFALIAIDTGIVKRIDDRAVGLARRRARAREGQADDGDPGPSVLRGRTSIRRAATTISRG